jgi:hypothetical protein
MTYLEKEATYKIQIPKDYVFEKDPNFTPEQYRKYWKDKLFRTTAHSCATIKYIRGYLVDDDGYPLKKYQSQIEVSIPKCWLGEMVKHCPQVAHYIRTKKCRKKLEAHVS